MQKKIVIIGLIALVIVGFIVISFSKTGLNQDYLTLYGNVDVRQVDLGFRADGRVTNMFFEEGDLVPKGTLMATLDKQPYLDQVRQARANLLAAKYNYQNAKLIFERRETLIAMDKEAEAQEDFTNTFTTMNIYEADYKASKAALGVALTNLKNTEIYSPTDGTILTRIREPGTVVLESVPIYTLSILSPVWIRAYIQEPELGCIYPGMPAIVVTDTQNGPTYKGHIGFISPVAEFTPKTVETTSLRTDLVYRLRIIADNPDKFLRQGMPVTVKLLLNKKKNPEKKGT
jgi:HlyD family secretion protein